MEFVQLVGILPLLSAPQQRFAHEACRDDGLFEGRRSRAWPCRKTSQPVVGLSDTVAQQRLCLRRCMSGSGRGHESIRLAMRGTRGLLLITHKSLIVSECFPACGEVDHSTGAPPDDFGSRWSVSLAVIVAAKGGEHRNET